MVSDPCGPHVRFANAFGAEGFVALGDHVRLADALGAEGFGAL